MAWKIKAYDENGEEYISSESYETREEAEAMVDAHYASGDLGCAGEIEIISEEAFADFENEEDYLDSLKKEDEYEFDIPFEYIVKHYGDDEAEMETAIMNVKVEWDSSEHGYKISYSCYDEDKIDPAEGNGTIDDFYEEIVYYEVTEKLYEEGIGPSAICI